MFGAAACFPVSSTGALSCTGSTAVFQHIVPVTSGNAAPGDLFRISLAVSLAIALVGCIPYAVVAALTYSKQPCPALRGFCSRALQRVDLYAMQPPKTHGDAPRLRPTPLGGALSVATVGGILALMAATVVQYRGSNTLLQKSSLPVTLDALAAFADLPLSALAASAAAGVSDPALLALTGPGVAGTGFVLTIATMGSRCGNLPGNWTTKLVAGRFAYESFFDSSTGAARHVFSCAS